MNDPLAVAAADTPTPVHIHLMHGYEPDLFFDGDRFMDYLDATYKAFDVATYSVSRSHHSPLYRVNRLIYGIRQIGTTVKPKEKRFIMNNHVKLFLCYDAKGQVDVYLGSQNLTHGTNLNLMLKAPTHLVEPLIVFFNTLWNSAS